MRFSFSSTFFSKILKQFRSSKVSIPMSLAFILVSVSSLPAIAPLPPLRMLPFLGGTIECQAPVSAEEKRVDNDTSDVKFVGPEPFPLNNMFDVVDEDEELEWDIKKDKCGFCAMFLDSPCRFHFQRCANRFCLI